MQHNGYDVWWEIEYQFADEPLANRSETISQLQNLPYAEICNNSSFVRLEIVHETSKVIITRHATLLMPLSVVRGEHGRSPDEILRQLFPNTYSESLDKHSADVDPQFVNVWNELAATYPDDFQPQSTDAVLDQHTSPRHMTPPFTEPVETVTIDTPRCGCGDEAAYYRAGKHFCSECLIESGDLE